MVDPGFVADLEFRGLWHQEAGTGLSEQLRAAPVTAYIGFDPTSDSLHVGSLLQLCMLRRLWLAGHRPIALAGGATGLIGDPGGKSDERPLLDREQLDENLAAIGAQLRRFLDFSDPSRQAPLLVDNSVWLTELGLVEFLRDVGKHVSVNEMMKRDSVVSRLERPEHGISYTEFSYMLLQAYDFLHLFDVHDCTLELGGSDQFGNILLGVELVNKLRGARVHGLTSPLVVKADGTKFGKTESGTVWLDARRTSPYELHQFFLRTEDDVVPRYLRYFTFLSHEEICALDLSLATNPDKREAQRTLAREVCVLVHGPDEARRAEAAAEALYAQKVASLDERGLTDVFGEVPSSTRPRRDLDGDALSLVELLVATGLAGSKGAARTLVSQGGAYVNDRRATHAEARISRDDLLFGRYLVMRKGKQDYHLLRFE